MHDYSMRGHPRERIIFYLAIGASTLLPVITAISGWIGIGLAVTSFTLFSVLFLVFDRYLWKLSLIRRLLGLPDLNGKWHCQGERFDSDGNPAQTWTGTVTIKQTWSRLSVAICTDTSRSTSGPASITADDGHGIRLLYNYQNEPRPGQPVLSPHHGTCELIFDEACTSATGMYFNDHNRRSFGQMKLTRITVPTKEQTEKCKDHTT
ncbi:hypothetical protein [Planctomicrobium sp. SH664]|uniref:Cap15 family cyclic dinucleotide receptor domain-containing protein n=1 Tax=Planctomicrobium sp. SH664 TaxID=3448125 RepID=UPI003F5C1C17